MKNNYSRSDSVFCKDRSSPGWRPITANNKFSQDFFNILIFNYLAICLRLNWKSHVIKKSEIFKF